jgi:hypothetical protein
MSQELRSFGASFATASASERYDLHCVLGDRTRFSGYDRVLSSLFARLLRGQATVALTRSWQRSRPSTVTFELSELDREHLAGVLMPSAQQARGAWYLPETDEIHFGIIEFAHWNAAEPRYAISASESRSAKVQLDSPDSLVAWAALEPVMEMLYLPLKLRSGRWLGERQPEAMAKDWALVDKVYTFLSIDPAPLAVFKDGRRWAKLTIEEVLLARQRLVAAWGRAPDDVGTRAIVLLTNWLIERYYAKAKHGMAERTKVIDKKLEKVLSATFGGDWLAFVRYLGEEIHPSEKISTAVESTSLVVSNRDRAVQVATEMGIPVTEVEQMLAVYWGGQGDSPVDRRVQVMREWWSSFDGIHARQLPGMSSLWGLVGTRFEGFGNADDKRFTTHGYRMFPPELNGRIEELWATMFLPGWPQRLVSEPYPQAAFAETFGDGLKFWHEIALTCWFICEGPSSRTDIAGMKKHYAREIKSLEEYCCPIDMDLFKELLAAEARLTDRPPSPEDQKVVDIGNGLSFTIHMQMGAPRKEGFEILRDIVSRYRRAWAKAHLERYLHARWEQDIRSVGDAYHRSIADKAKTPTPKQFAKLAGPVPNRWFAGSLEGLASALKLPGPEKQKYQRMLPEDRTAFFDRVLTSIGGQRWEDSSHIEDKDERERRLRRWELARYALEAVQIWEAKGERPLIKEASWTRYRLKAAYGEDVEGGWQAFMDAVEHAVHQGRV